MFWILGLVSAGLMAVFLYAAIASNRAHDRLVEDQRRREEGRGRG